MNDEQLETLAPLQSFLDGTAAVEFAVTAVQAMLPKCSIFLQSDVVSLRGQPQELVLHGQPAKDLLAAFNALQQAR